MTKLPTTCLDLFDATGTRFGALRFAPFEEQKKPDVLKGECIFDVPELEGSTALRHEARWLMKRGFERWGDHKFKLVADGTLTVSLGDFEVVFEPRDGGMHTAPPAPPVSGAWV